MLYNIIVILTQTLIMPMTFLASCSIKQHQTSLALTILQTEELDNNRVSAANSQEISIYFNKYLFGQNKYFLAYFWEENKYILA